MSNKSSSEVESIACYIRCKPLNLNEQKLLANSIEITNNSKSISLKNSDNHIYTFDNIFPESITQNDIFNDIGFPILKSFLSGYNSAIFCYGQTGSGKTYTMMGPIDCLFDIQSKKHGLIPNIINYLFNNTNEVENIIKNSSKENPKKITYTISCSCIELYQEQIIDLLSDNNNNNNDEKLTIREDSKRGMYIENLTEITIDSDKNAKEALMLGLKNRHVASTNMNGESSRSHLIYTLFLESSFEINEGIIISRNSRLHLIDLAGSERQKFTNAIGERIKEAGMINKSLSILGNVINAVIEYNEGKTKFIPFRDSKLTYYLKDSIGGNSKTVIIGNISQSFVHLNETQSTLQFIQRAKMIKNKIEIIENVNDKVKMLKLEIKNLNKEINHLKTQLKEKDNLLKSKYYNINHENKKDKKENENENKNQTELKDLMEKINKLFSFEDDLNQHFKFLDTTSMSLIENFLVQKEVYENEMKNILESLNKDNIIKEYKGSNSMLDKIKIFELLSENKKIKQEIEVYKSITQFFIKNSNLEENKTKMSNDIIKEFIKTNQEIKNFFIKNFDLKSEYLMVEKSYLNKLNFQIDELKIQDEQNSKIIDSLQSENFLLNMELTKFKENSINFENDDLLKLNIDNSLILNNNNPTEQFVTNLRSSLRKQSTSTNYDINYNDKEIDTIYELLLNNNKDIEDMNEKYKNECDSHLKDVIELREKLNKLLNEIFDSFEKKEKNRTFGKAITLIRDTEETIELNQFLHCRTNYQNEENNK